MRKQRAGESGTMKKLLKKIWMAIFHRQKAKNIDPFEELEARGLKIGESSKKRMHSPGGIDRMFPWLIEIGENCIISTNVIILAHDASSALSNGYTKMGRVSIGNHVFIGQGSTILCGVTIGDNVIIGAHSLVSKDLEPNSVYAGNPVRYICSFAEYRTKRAGEMERVPILEHDWIYWSRQASDEEKKEVAERLKESKICYIKSNMDPAK